MFKTSSWLILHKYLIKTTVATIAEKVTLGEEVGGNLQSAKVKGDVPFLLVFGLLTEAGKKAGQEPHEDTTTYRRKSLWTFRFDRKAYKNIDSLKGDGVDLVPSKPSFDWIKVQQSFFYFSFY